MIINVIYRVFFCLLIVQVEYLYQNGGTLVFGLAPMLLGPGEILLDINKVLRLIEC